MTQKRSLWFASVFELLSSMRFAVSLLVFVCLASVVGTLVPQNAPMVTYVDQFGGFWAALFDSLSLFQVYNAWWFLVVMGFLVLSTSLCLIRNTPKMLRDMRSFKEYVQRNSLRAIHHRFSLSIGHLSRDEIKQRVTKVLSEDGYQIKEKTSEDSILLAAKRGTKNRLGYIFAHASIVLICVGGLLDSELLVRLQVWFGGKSAIYQDMAISDVPTSGTLSVRNPSFRANMFIPEKATSANAIVTLDGGSLIQPLPFSLTLKQFYVEYYSTGMPKSFVSDVEVTDLAKGTKSTHTIRVNEPLQTHGVTIYQSSLADGGSKVVLAMYPILGQRSDKFTVTAKVGDAVELGAKPGEAANYKLEITDFQLTNVEQLGGDPSGETTKVFRDHVASVVSSATKKDDLNLQNVGPSVSYKLRDKSGQAFEYKTYMNPLPINEQSFFLTAVSPEGVGEFRYLRIPADRQTSKEEFLILKEALVNAAHREAAVNDFVRAQTALSEVDRQQLHKTSTALINLFSQGGIASISDFLQKTVPEDKVANAAKVVAELLEGVMKQLWKNSLRDANLAPLAADDTSLKQQEQWIKAAIAALSDIYQYPAPVMVELVEFDHVQASVFQMARTPGKWLVYLGSLLLILGVFAMFYIRERRAWVHLSTRQDVEHEEELLFALTTARRNLDFEHEFIRMRTRIEQALAVETRTS